MLPFRHSNSGTPLEFGTVHRVCAFDCGSEVGAFSASPPVIRAPIGDVSQENGSWGVWGGAHAARMSRGQTAWDPLREWVSFWQISLESRKVLFGLSC